MFPRYLWGADWRRYHSPILRTSVIIGYMQSGKTTMIRYLAYRMYREVTSNGVDESEIAFVEAQSLQSAKDQLPDIIDIERIRYLMVFVDDAIKSAHSRRHNVNETQVFSDVRHWTMRRGVLMTMYATQDFRLLDRLMRNAMVYIWKTLPLEWWISTEHDTREKILKWIGDPDVVEILETITQAIYSNNAEQSLAALKTAVVRIPVQNWGPKVVKGIQPREPPASIWYRIEGGEGESEEHDNIDARTLLHAITRLLHHLAGEGYRYKWNRGKYLIIKSPSGKEISLGPLGETQEIRQIIYTIRQNNYIPA